MTHNRAAVDLTGRWDGIFNYPAGDRSNTFIATLRDSGGQFVGETTEPSDDLNDCEATLIAWVEGQHDGMTVAFRKSYDDPTRADYAVSYRGSVSGDGLEINGTWDIPNVWSGTFIMVRPAAQAASIEQAVAETVR